MSEAAAAAAETAFPNPLLALHKQSEEGAEFQAYGERLEMVSTFGQPQAEYSAIRKACGMMDLPQRGILELTGKDRLAFLNNLLSNETWDKQKKQGVTPGSGVYAFFLNLKGRIVADVNVLELPGEEQRTLLEMDVRVVDTMRAALGKYVFGEQVKIRSRVGELHSIALHGPGAPVVLGDANLSQLAPLASAAVRIGNVDARVFRRDVTGSFGFQIIVPVESAAAVWTDLAARFGQTSDDELGKRALRPVGWAAFNATRIEAGTPVFGIDFDESVLPAELGGTLLEKAVSFTKGCYLGQEIVARMHARGQVARLLVGIRMDDDALPIAGTQIFDAAGNVLGGVTSSTVSPVLSNAAIAIGYVKRSSSSAGSKVTIAAEAAMHTGTVVSLPFI